MPTFVERIQRAILGPNGSVPEFTPIGESVGSGRSRLARSMARFAEDEGLDRASAVATIGITGNTFVNDILTTEEFNTALSGLTGAQKWDEMVRSDGQVSAVLEVQKLPLHGANWYIDCDLPDVKADLETQLGIGDFKGKGRLNWDEYLLNVLLCLDFGFEVMEKIWEINDGKMWLRKVAHRSQLTIKKWIRDEVGNLAGVEQEGPGADGTTERPIIPGEKLIHIARKQVGDNFEGISALRPMYKPWYMKELAERIEIMKIERWGLGIPFAEEPERGTNNKVRKSIQSMLKLMRAGTKAFFTTPYGWKIGILVPQGNMPDILPIIKHNDEQIARAALAMFLNLGTTASGSRALAGNFLDMFYNVEEALANSVVTVTNEQLIRDFLIFNYPNGANIEASLAYANLKPRSLEAVSKAVALLGNAGFLTPDEGTENSLRELADLAPKEQTEEDDDGDGDPEDKPEPDDDDLSPDDDVDEQLRQRHRRQQRNRLSEFEPWRELRPDEQYVAFAEIEAHQDSTVEDVVAIFRAVRPSWIESLTDQIDEALKDGDPKDLDTATLLKSETRARSTDVVKLLRASYREGRKAVRKEARKSRKAQDAAMAGILKPSKEARERMEALGLKLTLRDEPQDQTELTAQLRTRANRFFDNLAKRIIGTAQEEGLALNRTKGIDYDQDDLDRIADELTQRFDATARREAGAIVSESFSMGRVKEANRLKDDITYATYSALLDKKVCDVCAQFDGRQYQVGAQDYHADSPPHPQCLSAASGANKCRCLWVYTYVGQSAARG